MEKYKEWFDKHPSLEEMEEAVRKLWEGVEFPSAKRHSNGMWEINIGNGIIHCNDAGKKMLDEAVEKELNNIKNK